MIPYSSYLYSLLPCPLPISYESYKIHKNILFLCFFSCFSSSKYLTQYTDFNPALPFFFLFILFQQFCRAIMYSSVNAYQCIKKLELFLNSLSAIKHILYVIWPLKIWYTLYNFINFMPCIKWSYEIAWDIWEISSFLRYL